jgi:hypothetical protein
MRRLTEQQCVELCRLGGVPNDGRDRFVHAIERCVMYYQQSRERKTAPAVGAELAQIEKCAWRALRLLDRRTPRPAEFRRVVEHISARLRNLSSSAQEYLEFRNLKIQRDVILAAWPDLSDPGVLVDPICFTNQNDQVLALQDLLGAFAAPVAKKEGLGIRPKIWNALSTISLRQPIPGSQTGQLQIARLSSWPSASRSNASTSSITGIRGPWRGWLVSRVGTGDNIGGSPLHEI